MAASYPTSAKTFSTKNNGDTIQPSHINEVQEEITAIEQDLLDGIDVAKGGTGLTSYTTGDLLYASGAAALGKLADVATGQVLASGGVGVAPAYTADPSVTSITTSGAATIGGLLDASGAGAGQVKFPATQNASADANTLDDYEEGSWTPTIGGSGGESGQAYSLQVGKYVKIGKHVHVQFSVTLSALGTITTSAQIKGLPFTSENTANLTASGVISAWANLSTSVVWMGLAMAPNGTAITLTAVTAAATTSGNLAQGDLSNTTSLIGAMTYVADA